MMSDMEAYRGRVQATIWDAAGWVSDERRARAQRFLEHGEPAEAMCSLAWAISEERTVVPRRIVASIRDLSAELVPFEEMPEDLDDFAIDEPTEGSGLPIADG